MPTTPRTWVSIIALLVQATCGLQLAFGDGPAATNQLSLIRDTGWDAASERLRLQTTEQQLSGFVTKDAFEVRPGKKALGLRPARFAPDAAYAPPLPHRPLPLLRY